MSRLVTTEFGRLNHLEGGTWLWKCPECNNWAHLSCEQFMGRISVECPAWVDSQACRYHVTHRFDLAAHAVMQARVLMNESPYDKGEM